MAGQIIGRVVELEGAADVRGVDGTIRIIKVGETVREGDLVITGTGAEVAIDFLSGQSVRVTQTSRVLLDETVHRAEAFSSSELIAAVDTLQSALLVGDIDFDALPAPGAGPGSEGSATGDGEDSTNGGEGRRGGGEGAMMHDGRWGRVDVSASLLQTSENEENSQAPLAADGSAPGNLTNVPIDDGAEHPPSITEVSAGTLSEDQTSAVTGQLSASDPDSEDSPVFAAATASGVYGTFQIGTDGQWSYQLNGDSAEHLTDGQSATETVSVTASTADGETAVYTVTISITGAEDAPTISGNSSGAAGEDSVLNTTGNLSAGDVDAGDNPAFTPQTNTAGTYGSFSIDSDGAWSYALDNTAAQVLAGIQTFNETFTVTSTTADGETVTQTVSVIVSGSEDAPVITGTTTDTVTEDGASSAGGTLATDDVDTADIPAFTAQPGTAGTYGTFSITNSGAWTYTYERHRRSSFSRRPGIQRNLPGYIYNSGWRICQRNGDCHGYRI